MIPGAFPIITGGAIPASVVWTANTGDSSSQTTYTFTSVAIGTASDTRRVVVGIDCITTALRAISMTIGGITATEVAGCAGYNTTEGWTIRMFIAEVPTGTTATISATVTSGATGCRIGVFALYDLLSSTETSAAVDVTDPVSMGINVDAGGVGVAHALSRFAMTWTGLTENYDAVVALGQSSGASLAFADPQTPLTVTVTKTAGGSTTWAVCTASFR